jgi:hypothetical protein
VGASMQTGGGRTVALLLRRPQWTPARRQGGRPARTRMTHLVDCCRPASLIVFPASQTGAAAERAPVCQPLEAGAAQQGRRERLTLTLIENEPFYLCARARALWALWAARLFARSLGRREGPKSTSDFNCDSADTRYDRRMRFGPARSFGDGRACVLFAMALEWRRSACVSARRSLQRQQRQQRQQQQQQQQQQHPSRLANDSSARETLCNHSNTQMKRPAEHTRQGRGRLGREPIRGGRRGKRRGVGRRTTRLVLRGPHRRGRHCLFRRTRRERRQPSASFVAKHSDAGADIVCMYTRACIRPRLAVTYAIGPVLTHRGPGI